MDYKLQLTKANRLKVARVFRFNQRVDAEGLAVDTGGTLWYAQGVKARRERAKPEVSNQATLPGRRLEGEAP